FGPDLINLFELGLRCLSELIHGAEVLGQNLSSPLTDVANAEPEQNPPEFQLSARIYLTDQVFGRFLPHSLELFNFTDLEVIQTGNVVNQLLLDKLVDQTFPKAVDLHRSPARPV